MNSTGGGAVRAVAYVEGIKGLLALAAASGLLALVHSDLHDIAVRLAEHAHLNPAATYPRIFIDAAANLQNTRLAMIAAGALAYSALRLVEAYGLWYSRAWAEVLAAGSSAIYLPVEIFELTRRVTPIRVAFLVVNAAVVWVMVAALMRRRRRTSARV